MAKVCIKAVVTGKVQGVFYRASTQQKAQELGLRGYAKNCPDGSVEVVACGEPNHVEALRAWLWRGPAQSNVVDVQVETVSVSEFSGFEVY